MRTQYVFELVMIRDGLIWMSILRIYMFTVLSHFSLISNYWVFYESNVMICFDFCFLYHVYDCSMNTVQY